jgi:hypothetical protein
MGFLLFDIRPTFRWSPDIRPTFRWSPEMGFPLRHLIRVIYIELPFQNFYFNFF